MTVNLQINISIGKPTIQYQCHCGNRYFSSDSPSYGCPDCEKQRLERLEYNPMHTRECSRCRLPYYDPNEVIIPVCGSCIYREYIYQEHVRKAKKAQEDASNPNWKKEGF